MKIRMRMLQSSKALPKAAEVTDFSGSLAVLKISCCIACCRVAGDAAVSECA